METICRKRLRSDEYPYQLQSKMFINQQKIDRLNDEKMKRIHSKTISMLFRGAQNLENAEATKPLGIAEISQLVTLSGSGNLVFASKEKPEGFPKEKLRSKCCAKEAFITGDCFNCNLGLCEFCAFSCIGCGQFLCGSCIMLFECGTNEQPICERCKMFN
ncbi:apoptosis regulatory protein Siva-like [Eupeodes corollae]|uniref:apoptosis regulatory protein Siva-like n=1 Tax=Eupeodes corollae TaxID=290404 RepID=UPI002492E457|nr:apoptosis regulatory protein Siva-like [Eupeodes corollae]